VLALAQVLASVPQQAADLVERVVLVSASPEGVLLTAAPDLIDDLSAELDDMERVLCAAADYAVGGPRPVAR
jgi:hypothetical protein